MTFFTRIDAHIVCSSYYCYFYVDIIIHWVAERTYFCTCIQTSSFTFVHYHLGC